MVGRPPTPLAISLGDSALNAAGDSEEPAAHDLDWVFDGGPRQPRADPSEHLSFAPPLSTPGSSQSDETQHVDMDGPVLVRGG